jgi:hypothetical protein
VAACRLLTAAKRRGGFHLPPSALTVSTVGVLPRMRTLAADLPGVRLALSLPAPSQAQRVTVVASAAKNEWTLRVLASRRSGAVAVQLESPVRTVSLGAYAYFGAIKVLAEERLADEGLPFAEQGWLHPQAVGQALGMPQATLRVHLHRVRELLRAEGFADLAPIYEARATGEVRLGCARVVVDERD